MKARAQPSCARLDAFPKSDAGLHRTPERPSQRADDAGSLTLEFAVSLREQQQSPNAVYVAWMKVPPQVAWDLAQQISDHVAQFEEEYGSFTPRPPEEEELS